MAHRPPRPPRQGSGPTSPDGSAADADVSCASAALPRCAWRNGVLARGERRVAEETPVALVYNASTYAVMMASPTDLEDFAVGFSLTEGLVGAASEIEGLEIVAGDLGIEARIWLGQARAA